MPSSFWTRPWASSPLPLSPSLLPPDACPLSLAPLRPRLSLFTSLILPRLRVFANFRLFSPLPLVSPARHPLDKCLTLCYPPGMVLKGPGWYNCRIRRDDADTLKVYFPKASVYEAVRDLLRFYIDVGEPKDAPAPANGHDQAQAHFEACPLQSFSADELRRGRLTLDVSVAAEP